MSRGEWKLRWFLLGLVLFVIWFVASGEYKKSLEERSREPVTVEVSE